MVPFIHSFRNINVCLNSLLSYSIIFDHLITLYCCVLLIGPLGSSLQFNIPFICVNFRRARFNLHPIVDCLDDQLSSLTLCYDHWLSPDTPHHHIRNNSQVWRHSFANLLSSGLSQLTVSRLVIAQLLPIRRSYWLNQKQFVPSLMLTKTCVLSELKGCNIKNSLALFLVTFNTHGNFIKVIWAVFLFAIFGGQKDCATFMLI